LAKDKFQTFHGRSPFFKKSKDFLSLLNTRTFHGQLWIKDRHRKSVLYVCMCGTVFHHSFDRSSAPENSTK